MKWLARYKLKKAIRIHEIKESMYFEAMFLSRNCLYKLQPGSYSQCEKRCKERLIKLLEKYK